MGLHITVERSIIGAMISPPPVVRHRHRKLRESASLPIKSLSTERLTGR